MGLAASQVRLLMLTGRKDDVESNIMSLANQKLSLARKSADLSKEYSNALNATKLVWNNGSNDDVDLTYGLLMSYNDVNQKGQYMLADNYSRAVLNDTYANLFGGTANSITPGHLAITRQAFLEAMGLSVANASECISAFASNPSSSASSKISKYSDSAVWDYMATNGQLQYIGANNNYTETLNTTYSNSTNKDTANVVRCTSSSVGEYNGLGVFIDNVINDIKKALSAATGGLDLTAFNDAIDDTKAHYKDSMQEAESGSGSLDDNGQHSVEHEGRAATEVAGTNEVMESSDGTNTYFIDVNQLIKTFLNYYDGSVAEAAGAGDYGKYAHAVTDPALQKKSNGIAYGMGVTTRISSESTSSATPENFEKASFYLSLYEFVNKNGGVRSSSIDKDSGAYLQNQMQNGSIHLCKYVGGSDSSWDEVSTNSEENLISQVSDEDKASTAETKYNAEKDELDYKEQQLDLQMTNLDSERSALDTEVDSVKSILNKNIERSFKIFQNA